MHVLAALFLPSHPPGHLILLLSLPRLLAPLRPTDAAAATRPPAQLAGHLTLCHLARHPAARPATRPPA
jgi:hypothetical protein